MLDLAGALARPVAALLLKSYLGDAAAVVADLGAHLRAERVGEGDLNAAARELGATLETSVSPAFLVDRGLDADAIGRALLDARPPERVFPGEAAPAEAYRRLVAALAPRLRAVAPDLAGYPVERDAALLRRLAALESAAGEAGELLAGVARIERRLDERHDRERDRVAGYEALYRERLRHDVEQLRLLKIERAPSRAKDRLRLSIAYVTLRLGLAAGEGGDAAAGPQLDYPEMLALLPLLGDRLLIEGGAGCGKTTLLQWTALTALDAAGREPSGISRLAAVVERLHAQLGPEDEANLERFGWRPSFVTLIRAAATKLGLGDRPFPARRPAVLGADEDVPPWWARVPFLLRLRDCSDGRIPDPDEFPRVLARQAGPAPEGWALDRLRDGRALVLLDGIDEVPERRRDELRADMERYFALYPRAQFVATARPAAVLAADWSALFPWRAAVRPMAPVDIERFVAQWHDALRDAGTDDPPGPEAARRLTGQVLAKPALVQLAETPLLCAAVCYLHGARGGELPGKAARLYEAVSHQLVHRLDVERLRQEGYERLAPALAGLDLDDKLALLRRLAWFMVRQERSTLESEPARRQVGEALAVRGKLDRHDPAAVLAALQERSGVLRRASEELVEFAHNALRSYFAAGHFADEGVVPDVVAKSLAGDDPDLPVLAAAQGNRPYRASLIRALCDRADGAGRRRARRLRIAALRCRAAGGLGDEGLAERLAGLELAVLPPRDLAEAGQLADLGEVAVPHLARVPKRSPGTDAACVRSLRLIGGPAAEAVLEAYLDHKSEIVVEELAQGVDPLRVRAVAAFVGDLSDPWRGYAPLRHLKAHHLAALPDTTAVLNLCGAAIRDAAGLSRFAGLRELSLAGTAVADLGPLRGLAGLESLILDGTRVADLAPLRGLVALRELSLGDTSVTDLAPLRGLASLEALFLDGSRVADLAPLRGLAGLKYLILIDSHEKSDNPVLLELLSRGVHVEILT